MELNAEQIKKALECCVKVGGYRDAQICNDCPLSEKRCAILLPENALALINSQEQRIKELTEENERLRVSLINTTDAYDFVNGIVLKSKADTVRKMHSEIEERCIKGGIYPAFVKRTIDQIAKEMLEGVK